MTQPRTRKCAAYRSASISGVCAFTRNSSAGNFLAFGEVVKPTLQRSARAAIIWATLPHPRRPCNGCSAITQLRRLQVLNITRMGEQCARTLLDQVIVGVRYTELLRQASQWRWKALICYAPM